MEEKIKVKCEGLLNSAGLIVPVISMVLKSDKYVLLSHDERIELTRHFHLKYDEPKETAIRGYPTFLIREHSVDVEKNIINRYERTGNWFSYENIWVNIAIAYEVINNLISWQNKTKRQENCIFAPNWITATAVRKLAICSNMEGILPETFLI